MWPATEAGASKKEEVHRSVSNAENTASEVRDVIIVGSGPAGYTAAVYTARANLKPLLLAGSVTAGGELMNTTDVENYPGFPEGIMGPDLMENFEKQAVRFGTEIQFEDVTELDLDGAIKTVTIASGETFQARSIILSTGSAYRELGLPNEKRLSGHGVSWCATCDGFFFKDQDIAVIGGGDSAMEEALFLTKFARSVTVVHRRDSLRASKIMADRAQRHEKINFVWNTGVADIIGQDKVTGLKLKNLLDGTESELAVTGVFVAIGNDPRTDLVKDKLDLTSEGTIAVEGRTSKTSIKGVFAAGDVIDPTYRQAITASGSGCVAALDVEHYLAEFSA
ncbi:MAG: trxB [Arthrobacter sp.]|nr:trxB [Arthrobacter sp.]